METIDPSFIPVMVNGGIGDVICSIPILKALSKKYQIIVYTPHGEILKYFYPGAPFAVVKELCAFSWHLSICTRTRFNFTASFRRFLIKEHEEFYYQHMAGLGGYPKLKALLYDEPFGDRYNLIAKVAAQLGLDKRSLPFFVLGMSYEERAPQRRAAKGYITIHDGFDVSYAHKIGTGHKSVKQWEMSHWTKLVGLLGGFEVIQLGSPATARQVHGATSLIGKTTITEAFDVLAGSLIHIDGDSGLMHAATMLGVPCVALWGATPDYFYGYRQNINLKDSPCAEPCFWQRGDWMENCVAGLDAECMKRITPEMVLGAITTHLINSR